MNTRRVPTILFADDEAFDPEWDWNRFLIQPLGEHGIVVLPETDPEKVLGRIPEVDAVLLDMYWYGKKRGEELFHKIKETSDLPVIIMSSMWSKVGDDYIMKGSLRVIATQVLESLKNFGVI
jgi:hypothetical protein